MFKPETKPTGDVSESIAPIVDAAIQTERNKQPSRNYLGASRWGESCERKLGYEFHHTPKNRQFSGQILRIFDAGHDYEERVIQYLRLAGFKIETEKDGGGQIGFFVADGKLGGHCDGIIHGGPINLPYPVVFECKSLNDKSFNDTKRKGVKDSKPVYYAQIQTYCAYFDVAGGGLFVAINKNDGEIYYEHVPYDPKTAQEVSDRALRVIKTASPDELPRITGDKSNFVCKFCDYAETCWAEKAPQTLQTQPAAKTPSAIPQSKPFWAK
jgi:hypothetical protein